MDVKADAGLHSPHMQLSRDASQFYGYDLSVCDASWEEGLSAYAGTVVPD